MAKIWAENSYCQRRKVGALLVKDKMIISDGYNGTPQGFENVCEDEDGNTKSYVLHAEANAITKVAQSSNSSKDATLYVTTSPCIECAKLIIQSGIKRVVFGDLLWLCIKLAWSAWKVVLTLVCLPLLIVFMVLGGMMALALPLLVVVGIVAIIVSIFK